jgi:hypothetical protein
MPFGLLGHEFSDPRVFPGVRSPVIDDDKDVPPKNDLQTRRHGPYDSTALAEFMGDKSYTLMLFCGGIGCER